MLEDRSSSISDQEDHRENANVAWNERGRRARTKKNVSCTSTRTETERKTENQVERLV